PFFVGFDVGGCDGDLRTDLPCMEVRDTGDALGTLDRLPNRIGIEGRPMEEYRTAPAEEFARTPEYDKRDQARGDRVYHPDTEIFDDQHRDDHRERSTGIAQQMIERAALVEVHLAAFDHEHRDEVHRQSET